MIRTVIQLEKMTNYSPVFFIFGLMAVPASVSGCFVYPTSVVVIAGKKALLACTTYEGGSITSWHIPINILDKTTVYTAPVYKRDGTIRTPEKIAEGYFLTHPADNETNLQMNQTILSQAGLYVCTCDWQSTVASTVIVLDLEPTFTTNHTGTLGEQVTFSCSMSFNASSGVSCELKIQDASGFTVTRKNETTMNNGLIIYNLEHTIISNASSDQRHTCKVTLSTKGDKIYSRTLNAAVELPAPTGSTTDYFSNDGAQAEGGEESSPKLAIGLPVGLPIFAVVIIVAAVVYLIIRSSERDKMSSQSTKQSCDTNNSGSTIANDSVTTYSNDGYPPGEVEPTYAQVNKLGYPRECK